VTPHASPRVKTMARAFHRLLALAANAGLVILDAFARTESTTVN